MSTTIESKARRDIDVLRDELINMQGQFEMALPKHIPADRFVRVAMTAVQNNPDLLKCERRSFWNALMKCAQDGLLPDSNEAVILPFNTKVKRGGQETYELLAQYIPMIAGVRKKARNSGLISDWFADVIHEKDEWAYQRGDDPHIMHKPNLLEADRGKIIAAYSVCTFKDGMKSIEAMSVHEIERIRKMSKTPNGPGWTGHYGEMCKKTVARRHRKVLPASTDLDDLLRRDDDVHGSADFAERQQLTGTHRPKLVDFKGAAAESVAEEVRDDERKELPADQKPEEQPTVQKAKASKTAQEQQPAAEEVSAADAFERGRKDRDAKVQFPPEAWKGTPGLRDAWSEGWHQRDEELKAERK